MSKQNLFVRCFFNFYSYIKMIISHACSPICAHSNTVFPVCLFLTKVFFNIALTRWYVLESSCKIGVLL